MGVNTRRPPLPVPTETGSSMDDTGTSEVATNVTTRTDKTSYSVPEDGSPITINTQKDKTGTIGRHGRQKSQTSLLIEYFESAKTGQGQRSKPSVRVKVTPSSKKSKTGDGSVQITGIGSDRQPSYTRRISLSNRNTETLVPAHGTEISASSDGSGRPPVEIEVQHGSDISNNRSSRELQYAPIESNVSSMPPDSLLEGTVDSMASERSRSVDLNDPVHYREEEETLKLPTEQRNRSLSRERITQRVMEKLTKEPGSSYTTKGHERTFSNDGYSSNERRRRSIKYEDDTVSGAESSMLSSNPNGSKLSYRSDRSQTSRMTNNPKLLEIVEDTIKRMILPEINQIKRDQKTSHNKEQSFDYESGNLGRKLSKHSSSPNIKSKPKVVLNRDGDDPGTVLSRGDSEYRKTRRSSREHDSKPSSRRSSGHRSREGSYDEIEMEKHKSSKSSHKVRDMAAAGAAGGLLTAAALKHHESRDEDRPRRRRKSSRSHDSRSRSASITEETDDAHHLRKGHIPSLPMASGINDSEMTRNSILSSNTERPDSRSASADLRTPIREVSRGSLSQSISQSSSRTPTRNSVSRGIGMSHNNLSIDSPTSISTKARKAALAAAGLQAARSASHEYKENVDADGYGPNSPRSPVSTRKALSSPPQSVSSLRREYEGEEELIPSGLHPQSGASSIEPYGKREMQSSLQSASPSPSRQQVTSAKHSEEDFITPMEMPKRNLERDGTQTPTGESVDEWYARQHELNDRYRTSLDATTNRDSYQTNPYPEDDKRFTMYSDVRPQAPDGLRTSMYTDDSLDADEPATEQGVREISGANPQFVRQSLGVESAVASLMGPSDLTTSTVMSSTVESPTKANATYSERMSEHLRNMGKDEPALYEGSTLSENMPSTNRWAALKDRAQTLSDRSTQSSTHSLGRGLPGSHSANVEEPVTLGASGIPDMSDPMPEIGHFDDSKSDVTTNPSIKQGHSSIVVGKLGGEDAGKSAWPYTPSPALPQDRELANRDSRSLKSGHSGRDAALLGAAAGAGAAALAGRHAHRQPSVEDDYDGKLTPGGDKHGEIFIDREATPTSPAAFRDEGYVTNDARSAGAPTPGTDHVSYSKEQLDDFNRAMDEQDINDEDPFTSTKHSRHISGNSHGMSSPLYDSATGKGMDRIQSRDIVALMDHLTVRDAQRNARDTEILVTLVRSATEMRQNFDDLKRYIAEQDRLIMQNTDRDAEKTVQQVLGGPRPQPQSPRDRTPRMSQEEIQTKRKGVLSRALKGLTRGKSSNDLARFEDMLMQILDNVEDLKHQGGGQGMDMRSYAGDSLDSYEKLRAAPDPGYEPEGHAGTNSTPSQSGHFAAPAPKQRFHSGYNGRPGSENRVSTVLEGSEEDEELLPHEVGVLNQKYDDRDRYPTPTQERFNASLRSPEGTPPRLSTQTKDLTPKSVDKDRKHKSNSSSTYGAPKVSRWSRTTASSGNVDPATLDSPVMARKPASLESRSTSTLDKYDKEGYIVKDEDRLRSTQSLAREQERNAQLDETRSMRSQASRLTRTPSPLIPSEAGSYSRPSYDHQNEPSPVQEDDMDRGFDDPKYHSHRNSLLLQHPQPRQGPTGRHQTTLETQAHQFDDRSIPGTGSDLSQRTVSDFDPATWGSSGTAALARNRFSQGTEPMSPVSLGSRYGQKPQIDDALVPQKQATSPQAHYDDEDDEDDDWEPDYSHSGFARDAGKGGYYDSPYGSGHLLEPIEEVRYSMETDSGHISIPPIKRLVGDRRRQQDRSRTPEAAAPTTAMRSPARKITGPRPMGSKSPQPQSLTPGGTVRRKPVAKSQETFESETF